jgi:hypothetical protein
VPVDERQWHFTYMPMADRTVMGQVADQKRRGKVCTT